jgi:uncharacterized protein
MKKQSKITVIILICWSCVAPDILAQKNKVEDALLWKVTGKDLKEPSYLFGTFHLLDNRYADSLTNVMRALHEAKTVAVELTTDSTMSMRLMQVVQLKGTSLDKLLSAEDYEKTGAWLKELTGYDIAFFNTINPLTIQLFLMVAIQQKHYPMNPSKDMAMDSYFQKIAKRENKKLIAFETFEEQVQILYGQFSNERQAELLSKYVNEKEKAYQEAAFMNVEYRKERLNELYKLMNSQQFNEKEAENMLDKRNKKWILTIPGLMREQSTFVAVGAMHLAGDNGLVSLLRKQGYKVRPLKVKQQKKR